jgi:hypothetical protein
LRLRTFKVSFYFILKAGVEFLFFRVKKLKVSAVLRVLKAVIFGSRKSISGAEHFTAGGLLGAVFS